MPGNAAAESAAQVGNFMRQSAAYSRARAFRARIYPARRRYREAAGRKATFAARAMRDFLAHSRGKSGATGAETFTFWRNHGNVRSSVLPGEFSRRNPTYPLIHSRNPRRQSSQNQELVMKALITAFALLSFVAASTVPLITQAQAQTEQTTPKKKVAKKKKAAKKVSSDKKKTSNTKMKKPSQA
jgi:hypothetical protein